MEFAAFLTELERSLAARAARIDLARWRHEPAYRTHVMKGNAIRGDRQGIDDGVLQEAMAALEYSADVNEVDASGHCRLYGFEWQGIDLVAVTSPGPWGECVWKGEYRADLALELENNVWEFTLHMRGLLDFQATTRIGVFYTDVRDPRETLVGDGADGVLLREWNCPRTDTAWGAPTEGLLSAVFLRLDEPRIAGAYQWSTAPNDGAMRKIDWVPSPGRETVRPISPPRTPPA